MVRCSSPRRSGAPELGPQPPGVRQGADRARHERGEVRLLGLLPVQRPGRRLPRVRRGPDRHGAQRLHLRPGAHQYVDSGYEGCRAGRQPSRRVRRRCGHAARVFLACRTRRRRDGEPGQAARRTSTPTAPAASTTPSTSAPGRVRSGTCRSTRAWSWPPWATRSPATSCGAVLARREEQRVAPLMQMEEFTGVPASDGGHRRIGPGGPRRPTGRSGSAGAPAAGSGRRAAGRRRGCRATAGRGQVTLTGSRSPGAIGYLVHRAADSRRSVRAGRPRRQRRARRAARAVRGHDRRARRDQWYAVAALPEVTGRAAVRAGRRAPPRAAAPRRSPSAWTPAASSARCTGRGGR